MGVEDVKNKLKEFQASNDINALKKMTLEDVSELVTKFGFVKEDLPVIREMMCEKQEGGRSSTRKNRLKKKRNKKNKTQRGGDEGAFIMVGVIFAIVSLVACCISLPESRGSAVLNDRLRGHNHGNDGTNPYHM